MCADVSFSVSRRYLHVAVRCLSSSFLSSSFLSSMTFTYSRYYDKIVRDGVYVPAGKGAGPQGKGAGREGELS